MLVWVGYGLGGLAVVLGVVVAVGYLLPADHMRAIPRSWRHRGQPSLRAFAGWRASRAGGGA